MANYMDERRWLTVSLIEESQRLAVAMQIMYSALRKAGYAGLADRVLAEVEVEEVA
jgi:Tfp pilus assembly protein PilW